MSGLRSVIPRWVTLPRAFAALLVLFPVFKWGLKANGTADLLFIALAITGTVLASRLIRKSIWRLRNRLYLTWVFIGIVPIVLMFALAVAGTYIVAGQVAAHLVSSELQRRAESLAVPARIAAAQQMLRFIDERIKHIQLLVTGEQTFHYPPESTLIAPPDGWNNYSGYLLKDGAYYSAAIVKTGGITAVALAPIDTDVLRNIVPGIGALRVGIDGPIGGAIPPKAMGWERLDFPIYWGSDIPLADWKSPQTTITGQLFVTTRPSAVLRALFSTGIEVTQIVTYLFLFIFFGLLLVQLVAWLIGVSLTRTVTGAVHGLYEGTQRIAKGDFSWRIPLKGRDQLAELGKSFNNMTAQIENLVVIAKEKERLQSEVEIASEVQNQLFPRSAPAMKTIELVGVCHAARMVSGDYYDYLRLPDGNLALAIGDVAGKGISAALLMASIQSIMRTQLAAGLERSAAAGSISTGSVLTSSHVSTSSMVAQLNRQLHASTAPEKYATFFFGVYEENTRMLTYTNAGHLQPMLLRNGDRHLLDVTGTVVGMFPSIRYEEKTVELRAGDLLIAYTDGITEPENAYGEEFGVDRLAETALRYQNSEPKEMVAKIMDAVTLWSSAPELPDDMTVVIARGFA
jgi:phosphoserine phosphatase RsbU/P